MNFKKCVCILLALFVVSTTMLGMVFASPEASLSIDENELDDVLFTDEFLASASDHRFEGYSIDDIRRVINAGGQIYRDLRVQSDNAGTMTYQVPVQDSEVEYLLSIQDRSYTQSSTSTTNTNPFPVTQIRDSGRPHEDSIVIILLGDGFSANQYGTWPNPAQGTVLHHANNAINALMSTHPFGLFEDMLTVYVIHAHGQHPATGIGYLGTIRNDPSAWGGTTTTGTSTTTRSDRIHELADSVVDHNHQTMIQVISNAGDGTGWAWMGWHYQLSVTIAVTSIRNAQTTPGGHLPPVWPNGTAWHGTFIHEFGHSFGNLTDEHGEHNVWDERRANNTMAANSSVKWLYWAGHRNVLSTPTRFVSGGLTHPAAVGWAVPTTVSAFVGQSGCLMRASWGNRNFCGVCIAELVRRMALISDETFHGKSPSTNDPLPNTPIITIPQGSLRVLDSAFHGNTSLQTINIPASVNTIGDYAFIGSTGLKTIFNFNTTPQQINTTTFTGLNRANINVVIPSDTTQAYMVAGWTGFNLIENNISVSASGLTFNGASFVYSMIEIAGSNLLVGTALQVEVRKHSGSIITTAPLKSVILNQTGTGEYTSVPTSVGIFGSGDYIEILVYADNLKQNLLTRQLIHPVVFAF